MMLIQFVIVIICLYLEDVSRLISTDIQHSDMLHLVLGTFLTSLLSQLRQTLMTFNTIEQSGLLIHPNKILPWKDLIAILLCMRFEIK